MSIRYCPECHQEIEPERVPDTRGNCLNCTYANMSNHHPECKACIMLADKNDQFPKFVARP